MSENISDLFNDAAEQSVLGAILLSPGILMNIEEIISASDFYRTKNSVIFSSIQEYCSANSPSSLDLVSLIQYLSSRKRLEIAGGTAYISGLSDNVTTFASSIQHAKIIRDLSLRRSLIRLSSSFADQAKDQSEDILKIIDTCSVSLAGLNQSSSLASQDTDITAYVTKALSALKSRLEGQNSGEVPTGFSDLDRMTCGGFQPTDFIVIAARPSIGKTAFALSIIRNMLMNGKKVALFSLEMSGVQIVQRFTAAWSGVPLFRIRQGLFSTKTKDFKFDAVSSAMIKLSNTGLHLIDVPNMKLSEIKMYARKLRKEEGIEAVFIDYIGLIDAGMPNARRFEQVAEISKNLKALARELEIPVIVLCQVTRDAEGDKNEPQLNNLRDSGAIEQDADVVMFLHRARTSQRTLTLQETKVIVAKQRNGETGEFYIDFNKETASFSEKSTFMPYENNGN